MNYIIETRGDGGTWNPRPETFDTISQAEQHIVNEIPETVEARIVREGQEEAGRPH